jgi:hypothetical protein
MCKSRKFIIWGGGEEGLRLLFSLQKNHQEVQYVIDSFLTGELQGISITKDLSSIPNIKDYYIVVATKDNTYIEIRNILLNMGLLEFDDFILGSLYYRKIVVMNGNCHVDALKKYLMQSKQFQQKYGIYPVPPIQNNNKGYIDDSVLAHADVLIYQDVRANNSVSYKLSYEYILTKISPLCKKICIPNMVGNGAGFFPTQRGKIWSYKTSWGPFNLFYKDTLIDEAFEANKNSSLADIVDYVENRKFDELEIKQKFNEMMKKIRDREVMWDVKVADFIENNYRQVPIMVDASHPADTLMDEIGRQVADFLEIKDIPKQKLKYCMGLEAFIWSGVKKALGIEYTTETVRVNYGCILGNKVSLTLSEYLQAYIWCFYNVLVE